MLKEYPFYGLQEGEQVEVTRESGCYAQPSKVEVVKEYATYILLQFFFDMWDGTVNTYKRCFNKGMLLSGDAKIRRKGGATL